MPLSVISFRMAPRRAGSYLQGIDNSEIIDTVHPRRPTVIPPPRVCTRTRNPASPYQRRRPLFRQRPSRTHVRARPGRLRTQSSQDCLCRGTVQALPKSARYRRQARLRRCPDTCFHGRALHRPHAASRRWPRPRAPRPRLCSRPDPDVRSTRPRALLHCRLCSYRVAASASANRRPGAEVARRIRAARDAPRGSWMQVSQTADGGFCVSPKEASDAPPVKVLLSSGSRAGPHHPPARPAISVMDRRLVAGHVVLGRCANRVVRITPCAPSRAVDALFVEH
jgi:hypothetical protein